MSRQLGRKAGKLLGVEVHIDKVCQLSKDLFLAASHKKTLEFGGAHDF
jgi:hypothetical protein